MLSGFCLLKGVKGEGGGSYSESAIKAKFVTKVFFQIKLNEVLANL